MTEFAEIKKTVKQTYAQTAQKAMTANTATIAHVADHHHTSIAGHNCEIDLEQDGIRKA